MSWILFLILPLVSGQTELLRNPNFEEAFDRNNWHCNGCQLNRSTDAYEGQSSAQVTQRRATWGSVAQYVRVEPGKRYLLSAYIKVLNQQEGKMFHRQQCNIRIIYEDGETKYLNIGISPYTRQDRGWIKVGGDFIVSNKALTSARLNFPFTNDVAVNYLMDKASLKEIINDSDWKQEADGRIETYRKRDIKINLNASDSYNPASLEINVQQIKHDFAFGSAVKADWISGNGTQEKKYQDTFYNMFQWAVLENSLKWRLMEWRRGNMNFARPEAALTKLEEHGVPVRGHCILWNKEKNVPGWLVNMTNSEKMSNTRRRINYVVSRFKGRLQHWDVNNEHMHGTFFETAANDPWYTEQVFRDTRNLDSDVKLFFNEFSVVNNGLSTVAYAEQIKHAVANNVPVYGIGCQGHFKVDITTGQLAAVAKRLDEIESVGLPMWITELTVKQTDRSARAQGYEDLIRLFFSRPSIEGILLWGFWDGAIHDQDVAIVEGPDFTPNEAGRRYLHLVKTEWTTNSNWVPTSNQQTLDLRGFHGLYNVTVNYEGKAVKTQQFSVPKGSGAVQVQLDV